MSTYAERKAVGKGAEIRAKFILSTLSLSLQVAETEFGSSKGENHWRLITGPRMFSAHM